MASVRQRFAGCFYMVALVNAQSSSEQVILTWQNYTHLAAAVKTQTGLNSPADAPLNANMNALATARLASTQDTLIQARLFVMQASRSDPLHAQHSEH